MKQRQAELGITFSLLRVWVCVGEHVCSCAACACVHVSMCVRTCASFTSLQAPQLKTSPFRLSGDTCALKSAHGDGSPGFPASGRRAWADRLQPPGARAGQVNTLGQLAV